MDKQTPPVPTPGFFTRRPCLFIDVQHGLSNRLRAMASAASIAEKTGRDLVVVWRPDHHCEARLHDLLDYGQPVIDGADIGALRARARLSYNYMEIEKGARFEEPILPGEDPGGDIFIRSAYSLVSPHADIRTENRFLRNLRPNPEVRALIRSVPRPSHLSLHVRVTTGGQYDSLSYESPANWPKERHDALIAWREKSRPDRFIARLDQLVASGEADTIFAAADNADTYQQLIERYGPRLRWLERTCFDRSTEQLRFALADLVLLTTAPRMLASSYSSFSDVAARLAPPGFRVERSGYEF